MSQIVYIMFITNSRALFQLWRKENLVKHQKVSKYYENKDIMKIVGTEGLRYLKTIQCKT